MWQNVTYRIEWFSEGNSLYEETICGGLPPGEVNANPCPGGQLVSQLPGNKYDINRWVRYKINIAYKFCIYFAASFTFFLLQCQQIINR